MRSGVVMEQVYTSAIQCRGEFGAIFDSYVEFLITLLRCDGFALRQEAVVDQADC